MRDQDRGARMAGPAVAPQPQVQASAVRRQRIGAHEVPDDPVVAGVQAFQQRGVAGAQMQAGAVERLSAAMDHEQ